MDPRKYVDARWSALVRAAVLLGASESEAPAIVQRVLDDNQRQIKRAEDPDPLVHRALAAAIPGAERTAFAAEPDPLTRQEMLIDPDEAPLPLPPAPRRRRWPAAVAAVAVLAAVGAAVAISRPDPLPTDHLESDQVPSLFGYSAATAREHLKSRGLDVTLEPSRDCEVLGRVVASDPGTGATYQSGDPIIVYSSLPSSVECLPHYTDQVLAWALLDFANDRGLAPRFADRVVVHAGDGPATVLTASEAVDRDSWSASGILATLRRASSKVALVNPRPVSYAVPEIQISPVTVDLGRCGEPESSAADDAHAFTLQIRSPTRIGCPVRLDIHLDGSAIKAVSLYPTPSWSD